MKSTVFAALVMAAVSLQAIPAFAQTFTPAPGRTFSMDLDTAPGNFSTWSMTDLLEVNAVRAKFVMRRAGVDKTFAPSFSITVASEEDSAQVGGVASGKKNARMIVLSADQTIGGKRTSKTFFTQIELDEVVDLEIEWTPEGKIRFALTSKATRAVDGAAETHVIDLGKRPTAVTISNSTSQLEVLELTAGGLAHKVR